MEIKTTEKCIICDGQIKDQGDVVCLECEKACKAVPIDEEELNQIEVGQMGGFHAKSDCCNADVSLSGIKSTCSDKCHEKLVERVEMEMGVKIFEETDMNGNIRLIPVRDLVSKGGLTEAQIMEYPLKPGEVVHNHADGVECLGCKIGLDRLKAHREEMMRVHGWIVDLVFPVEGDVDMRFDVHTHGLETKFKHMELQIKVHAHDPKVLHGVIHAAVDLIKEGVKFEAGKEYLNIITIKDKDFPVRFEYAKVDGKKALRMILPSADGKFSGNFYDQQVKDILKNIN